MPKPDYLDQLIDEASKAAGSDYKLATELGTSRQTVSNWRHGHKSCPVGDQVLMAKIAGLEPEAWAARAIVAQYEGTKADRIKSALKKSLGVTGAVSIAFGCIAANDAYAYFIRCIND